VVMEERRRGERWRVRGVVRGRRGRRGDGLT
jgi:hypothetical protein